MLLRYDPFREFDRLTGDLRRAPEVAMDAVRRGHNVVLHLDLPGVRPEDVDVTVERNVLTVTAERQADRAEGDEVLVSERRHGKFRRQFLLSEGLDPGRTEASHLDGVLTLRIPVAETAKPKKVTVAVGAATEDHAAITA